MLWEYSLALSLRVRPERSGWRTRNGLSARRCCFTSDGGGLLTVVETRRWVSPGSCCFSFTQKNLRYAVLKAMGSSSREILLMLFAQAGRCALIGSGIGLGLCVIGG